MTRAGQLANADSSTRARAGHVSYTRSGQAGRRQAWQSEAKPGKLEAEGKLTGDSPPKKKPEAPSISNENQSTPSALAVCEGVCVCKRESVCVSVKERQSACESELVCVC